MPVTVSKEFRWEMGHRLPYHPLCRNVHGHSYRMVVEVTGEPDEGGMVVDFGDIAACVRPIVDRMDHAFMLDPTDSAMREFLCGQGLKILEVPFHSTAENIATWLGESVAKDLLARPNVSRLRLLVYETGTSCAIWIKSKDVNR
ncbi:MAG: 6-pyruvoyl tetrahydropterin synthase family protein [Armatimonadetes bacterium]|nr:6-pyruvoyl tetrahydropterin synthase family protein [Armatimonadota bacterium]